MAFSYSLFLVLLLLFPGLCFWAGFRLGERSDFLTPSPDRPNSTTTLLMIVLGTMLGHLLGAGAFAVQAGWCRWTGACVAVDFDPNVYRALLRGAAANGRIPDLAIEAWLVAMLGTGIATFAIGGALARSKRVTDRLDPIAFGWLNPAVQAVKAGHAVVVAYVVTKTSHDGMSLAYEGLVQQLGLDEDQSVRLVVLSDVDRFLVRIGADGVERVSGDRAPLTQLQIRGDEIANIAFEVVRSLEVDFVGEGEGEGED